jgi:serine/threonine protein kinase
MMDVLGYGRSGAVYRALFRHEIVAIKACDIWQVPHYEAEILSEIGIYMALELHQGDVIPRFKGAGYSAGGLLLLITELACSPIDTNNLSDLERGEIITALSRIHSEGVIHNDIRQENILIERHPKSFTIKIIDFALSKKSTSKNEAKGEMLGLKSMLGYGQIKNVTRRKIMAARMARVGQRKVEKSVTSYVPILIRIQKAVVGKDEILVQLKQKKERGRKSKKCGILGVFVVNIFLQLLLTVWALGCCTIIFITSVFIEITFVNKMRIEH